MIFIPLKPPHPRRGQSKFIAPSGGAGAYSIEISIHHQVVEQLLKKFNALLNHCAAVHGLIPVLF